MYVKLKYRSRFWSKQPVFHIYDIYYWFYVSWGRKYNKTKIIRDGLPDKNKFTNFNPSEMKIYCSSKKNTINNIFKYVLDISTFPEKEFVDFISNNYLREREIKYNPTHEQIMHYFIGHEKPYYMCLYYDEEKQIDASNQIIYGNKLIGCISGRPLNVNYYKADKQFVSNYVDFLCVHKHNRKRGVSQQLIQTIEYIMNHNNPSINTCIFKRDGTLTNIIPMSVFSSYIYDILKWKKPQKVNNEYVLFNMNKGNYHMCLNKLNIDMKKHFDCAIVPYINNIYSVCNDSVGMYVYVLKHKHNDNILAYYVFRNSSTIYNNYETLEMISSLKTNKCKMNDFNTGFHNAMFNCFKKANYKYLLIENISHNDYIINELSKSKKYTHVIPSAYYFYNFLSVPIHHNKLFVIC